MSKNNTTFLNTLINEEKDPRMVHSIIPNASGPDPEDAQDWKEDSRDTVLLPTTIDPEEAFPDEWLLLNKIKIDAEGQTWAEYRRLETEPLGVGRFFNRNLLSKAEMCDFSPPTYEEMWHFLNLRDEEEKITGWDRLRTLDDGTVEWTPNWDHLNRQKEIQEDLLTRILDRIEKIKTKKQFLKARAYISAQARASILRKQGLHDKRNVPTPTNLTGLNYIRYATAWNSLMRKGLQLNFIKETDRNIRWAKIKTYDNKKKKEVQEALDAPRGGMFLLDTKEFAHQMDYTEDTPEKFSTLNMKWYSPNYKPTPRYPYFRLNNETITAWMTNYEE